MRILSIIFLFIIGSSTAYGNTINDKSSESEIIALKAYIKDVVIKRGYDIVNDKSLSEEQKRDKSADAIKKYLYLDWMAKQSLRRNIRGLSPAKVKEFTEVYSAFVVKAYAGIASNYRGETVKITGAVKKNENMFIVTSEFIRPGSQSPIKVEYLVHKIPGRAENPYMVGDIIAEGISTLNSQQSEFDSVITSHGIDWLINDLKTRTAKNTNLIPKK